MSDFIGEKVIRQQPWFFEDPWGFKQCELKYCSGSSSEEEDDCSSDEEAEEVAPLEPQAAGEKMLKMEEGRKPPVPSPRPPNRPAPAKKLLKKMKPSSSSDSSSSSSSDDSSDDEEPTKKQPVPQCQMPEMENNRTTVETEKENTDPILAGPIKIPPPQQAPAKRMPSNAPVPVGKPQTMPRRKPTKRTPPNGSGQESRKKPTAPKPTDSKRVPAVRGQPKKTVDQNAYDPRAIAVAIPKLSHRREEVHLKRHRLSEQAWANPRHENVKNF